MIDLVNLVPAGSREKMLIHFREQFFARENLIVLFGAPRSSRKAAR